MYNHSKAQQSKNRVHISWDILYYYKSPQTGKSQYAMDMVTGVVMIHHPTNGNG